MHGIEIISLVLLVLIIYVNCEHKDAMKSKNILPYFRRKVEEVGDGDILMTTDSDDTQNLVSFLVKNVREIFDDIIENSEPVSISTLKTTSKPTSKSTPKSTVKTTTSVITTSTIKTTTTTTESATTPITTTSQYEDSTAMHISALINNDFFVADANISISNISTSTYTYMNDNMLLVEHLSLTTLLDKKLDYTDNEIIYNSPKNEVLHISKKDLNEFPKSDKKQREISVSEIIQPEELHAASNMEAETETTDPRRSCIMCNNVGSDECNDPKNKLIPSIVCERDDDLCYSLHTPFGIVDRGCFNVNHNVTTYVCSCNLCNYVSISEMPFIFSKKREWLDNIIELSRTRHFRKSVFKDMSCLKCEVNTTTRAGDMLESANCLEGNIGNLPVEECDVDEVCAVKALRANGYIWRGCVKAPLYNYWLTVCDQDLCNYDPIISLYNFLT